MNTQAKVSELLTESSSYFDRHDKNSHKQFQQLSTKNNQSQQYIKIPNQQSLTEQEIYSHHIIRQLMDKSRAKTINHSINEIDSKIQLYSKPNKLVKEDFGNGLYGSPSSKQIKKIYEKIYDQQSIGQKIMENISKLGKVIKNRSQSVNLNKKISVGCLVSRNFRSLNARRSLGFNNKQTNEQKLKKQIQKIENKKHCPINRQRQIIFRLPNKSGLLDNQIQQAATTNFTTTTPEFLKTLKQYTQQNSYIYGDRMERLKCIQQYMLKQQTSYQDASFIVNQIRNQNKQRKNPILQRRIFVNNEQSQFKRRKKVLQNQRVMLRQLYFSQS